MAEKEESPTTAVIGRGESIITKKAPDADVEAENSQELAKREDAEIVLAKEGRHARQIVWEGAAVIQPRSRQGRLSLQSKSLAKLNMFS